MSNRKPTARKKAKPRKMLIGISFGSKSNRQTIYAIDCESRAAFMKERKSIKKYAYNPRDIHGTDPYKK